MMIVKFKMLLAGAAFLLAVAGCSSRDSTQDAVPGQGGVAATVNGAPLSENLVNLLLKQRTDLGRPADAGSRSAFIDRLVTQLVVAQEAVKKGLDKSPDVAAQLEMSRQSILANAFVHDYIKNNPVTEDMLKAEYEKMKAQSSGTEYRARHILVEQDGEARDVIAALKKNPKAFEALAKEKSRDPGSRGRGGELGWVEPQSTAPEIAAVLIRLAKGQFTEEPVKSQFGYHVVLLEDARAKQVRPLDEIKAAFAEQVQGQNMERLFKELKAKAKIELASGPAVTPAKDAQSAEPAKRQ